MIRLNGIVYTRVEKATVNRGMKLTRTGVVILAILASTQAWATIITLGPIDAADSGWYHSGGNHNSVNPNYAVGTLGGREFRDFFVFDLTDMHSGPFEIVSAELRLWLPDGGYVSPDASELYELYSVETDPADVMAGGSGHTDIFDDLGDGTLYGSATVAPGDQGSVLSISLLAGALADMGWWRGKWPTSTKRVLRFMFYCAMRFSDFLVYDSEGIRKMLQKTIPCKRNTYTIAYGAHTNPYLGVASPEVDAVLEKYGLAARQYYLVVSRLEPENNVDVIIDGYRNCPGRRSLVIVGNLRDTAFVRKLRGIHAEKVRFVGGIYSKSELRILRANAAAYVHGHSVGGTNPSLLEAMASANVCVCHDNIFNREVAGDGAFYFGDKRALSDAITRIESADISDLDRRRQAGLRRVGQLYNWDRIAEQYDAAFQDMLACAGREPLKAGLGHG